LSVPSLDWVDADKVGIIGGSYGGYMAAAVQANEVPVEYVVFEDEGHGFRRRENRITASEAYLRFLDTYLEGKE